jgi:hypothetical protein
VTFVPGPKGYAGRYLVRIESERLRGWVELDSQSRHAARVECAGAFPRCIVTLWERESDGMVVRVGVISAPANAVIVEGAKS